jgi:hypothetical protein
MKMLSLIAHNQIIAQDQPKERTTTDDAMPSVSAATGRLDEKTKEGSFDWRKAVSIAVAAGSLGVSATPALAEDRYFIPIITEQTASATSSVAQALSKITERYESVIFSYPARVLEIERNVSGDAMSVTVLVSVDGNDTVIKRPVRQFGFELRPDMRLIVDGVQRGGTKHLAFRVAQPLQLDEEQQELLRSIVSAFKTA